MVSENEGETLAEFMNKAHRLAHKILDVIEAEEHEAGHLPPALQLEAVRQVLRVGIHAFYEGSGKTLEDALVAVDVAALSMKNELSANWNGARSASKDVTNAWQGDKTHVN